MAASKEREASSPLYFPETRQNSLPMKITSFKLLPIFGLAFLLLLGMSSTGCKKEGCTNPKSDNYNPDAKADDGSCIPWRNKFLGTYTTSGSCIDELGLPDDNLSVTPSTSNEQKVIFELLNWTWTGTVTEQFKVEIPDQPFEPDTTVTMRGSGTIDDKGQLTLNLEFGTAPFLTVCTYVCDPL